ncbi:histidine--tRNA ligase [Patescibacteria group bacterium]|nr:histidine--tRNA ligase [Patescibacteria group bacterium]
MPKTTKKTSIVKKKEGVELKKTEKKTTKTPNRVAGVKDFFGLEGEVFSLITNKAIELANLYSFKEIKVPVLESFDLYKKSSRKNNDKEFYFIDGDKGEKQVLRPELTQGIIRAYLENISPETPVGARLFSLGPVFRREKPQGGNYREFIQADFEIIGDKKPLTEAILIATAVTLFKELNIKVQVQINSLGDAACRREYSLKLAAFFKERGKKTKLCNHCKNNLTKSVLSLLDCKDESCLKLREEAPQIADFLSADSREHFTKTLEFLDELEVSYNFSPYLVRGLNYYNDTVFEFWPISDEGQIIGKNSLAAGGRYDNLIESFGGPNIPALGLAVGIERTASKIKDKSALINKKNDDIIFIAQLGDQAKLKSLQLFEDLRHSGFCVKQSLSSDSLKAQLEEAVAIGARNCLILGKKEIMDGTVLMRDMDSGAQETIIYKKVKERLEKINKIVEKKIKIRKED